MLTISDDQLDQALELFASILLEHVQGVRVETHLTINVLAGRLRILEHVQ